MAYAELEDVRQRLGRPITSGSETDLVNAWLADALRYIRRGFARRGLNLDNQVAFEDPAEEDVVSFQAEAVAERLRNFDPEGLSSVTRTVDDGTITKRREGASSGSNINWLSDEQWDELLPLDKAQAQAFSIRPTFQPDCAPWAH